MAYETFEEFLVSEAKSNPSFANGLLDNAIAATANELQSAEDNVKQVSAEAQKVVDEVQTKLDKLHSFKSGLNPQPLPPENNGQVTEDVPVNQG